MGGSQSQDNQLIVLLRKHAKGTLPFKLHIVPSAPVILDSFPIYVISKFWIPSLICMKKRPSSPLHLQLELGAPSTVTVRLQYCRRLLPHPAHFELADFAFNSVYSSINFAFWFSLTFWYHLELSLMVESLRASNIDRASTIRGELTRFEYVDGRSPCC